MTRVHIAIAASDIAASTAFYTALFGGSPDKVRQGYARFQPDDVPLTLSLNEGAAITDRGVQHFGVKLETVDAVQSAQRRLAAAGLVESTEEGVTCCWAVQDKVWSADPDGNAWEIYAVTDDLPTIARDSASTCCTPEATAAPAIAGPSCCG